MVAICPSVSSPPSSVRTIDRRSQVFVRLIRYIQERDFVTRYGDADEVAAAIVFLLSDDARFVSGHDLVVDGALTAAAIRYDRARADAETRR